jgi:hypothetical protein
MRLRHPAERGQRSQICNAIVAIEVQSDLMPFIEHTLHDRAMNAGVVTKQEERGLCVSRFENVEDRRRNGRLWTIIKRKSDGISRANYMRHRSNIP